MKYNQTEFEEPVSTVKISVAPAMNEREYAQYCLERAQQALLKDPKNPEKLQAFIVANKHYWEVEDAYRIALRLLLERAINLKNAVRTVFLG